jgi:hypothetical protein
MLVMQRDPLKHLHLHGIEASRARYGFDVARSELVFEVEDCGTDLVAGIYFNRDRFCERTIETLSDTFVSILTEVIDNPHVQLKRFLHAAPLIQPV